MLIRTSPRVPIAMAAAVLGLIWALAPGGTSVAPPTRGQHVIAFGDSLIEGRGATPGHDAVSLLSMRLGVPILNAGRSGDTTALALRRLDRDVLARDPRVVIVLLGGNDYLRRVPADETFSNLAAIVSRIRAHGAAVILAGVRTGLFSDSYAAGYERIAREHQTALVPDILGGIIGHADLMADTIHPNDRGYALVADRLEPALRQLERTRLRSHPQARASDGGAGRQATARSH